MVDLARPRRLFITTENRLRCENSPGEIYELDGPPYDAARMLSRVINASAIVDLTKWTRITDQPVR